MSKKKHLQKLMIGAGGVYASFIYYGYLHEDVFRFASNNGQRFKYVWFLQVVEALTNVVVAFVGMQVFGSTRAVPLKYFGISGISLLSAKACHNLALANGLSYPVATIAKCGKMAPVMFGTFLLGKTPYQIKDYLKVFAIICGSFILLALDNNRQNSLSSTLGLIYIGSSLFFDGVTAGFQAILQQKYKAKPKPYDFMFWTNFFILLAAMLIGSLSGELLTGMKFCSKNPDLAQKIILCVLCNSFGQSFVFYTLSNFGPLFLAAVTTSRKIITVMLSIVKKGHKLNKTGWFGLLLVFCGIMIDVVERLDTPKRQQKAKPDEEASKSRSFIFLAFLSTVALSTVFPAMSVLQEAAPPIMLAQWRVSTTVVSFLPFLLLEMRTYNNNWGGLEDIKRLFFENQESMLFILFAALGSAAYNSGVALANSTTSPSHVAILSQSAPIILGIKDLMCSDVAKIKKLRIVNALCVFVLGLILIARGKPSTVPAATPATYVGDAFAVFAACGMALTTEFDFRARRNIPVYFYLSLKLMLSAFILLVLSWIFEGGPSMECFGWLRKETIHSVVFLAFVPGLLGVSILGYVSPHIPPITMGAILGTEPVFAILISLAIGSESIQSFTTISLVGAACVLISSFMIIFSSGPKVFKARCFYFIAILLLVSVASWLNLSLTKNALDLGMLRLTSNQK